MFRPDLSQLPKVFVSFSSHDKEFVQHFLTRLSEQPFNVWIFGEEEGEIPTGQEISTKLRNMIDESNWFIALVSSGSLRSVYTNLEVAYALKCERVVFPVVSHSLKTANTDWGGAYQELQHVRHRVVDFGSVSGIEDVIHTLCVEAKVEYQPLVPQDPRLPFMDRFIAEVKRHCPRRTEYGIGTYRRLMSVLGRFSEAFEAKQFGAAAGIMQYFCLMFAHEFPGQTCYYAGVVKGVCEILASDIEGARQTFLKLLNNPLCEESTFGGLGWICQYLGDHDHALQYYREASARCPNDPAALTGIAINALMTGQTREVQEFLHLVDSSRISFEEDRLSVETVQAFAFAHLGETSRASTIFQDLIDRGCTDAATIIRFAQLLVDRRKLTEAIALLCRFKERCSDPGVLHHLALYNAFSHDLGKAQILFRELVQLCPGERRYRIEAAQIAWHLRRCDEAREFAVRVLDRKSFPLPESSDDFYWDGFANWILGQTIRADYDFERSGYPRDKHYSMQLQLS